MKVTWRELTDEEEAAKPIPPSADGFYDASALQSKGIFRLLDQGTALDQSGESHTLSGGEYIKVLSEDEVAKYFLEDWVLAAGPGLRVRLSGRVESLRASTLISLMPQGWEPPT